MSREKKQHSGLADARENDGTPREPFVAKLKAVVVILLLFLVPTVLYQAFTRYMYFCTIPLPAGTTVVDRTMIPLASSLGKYITGKFPRLQPYLEYRHYVIPKGATEIAESAFAFNKNRKASASRTASRRSRRKRSWDAKI